MRFCKSFDHIMLLPCACRQILGHYVTYSYQYEYFSIPIVINFLNIWLASTVKLGNKERFDKEQIGNKELFVDYQPFYTINLLLDKELLPV